MNKTGFLKELKTYLVVLKESEQTDILDEYAQHIDMKMERGMSEAEAIKDFGGIRDLAAEILEAYHVNPQFQTTRETSTSQKMEEAKSQLGAIGNRLQIRMEQILRHLWTCIIICVTQIWKLCAWPITWITSMWNKRKSVPGTVGTESKIRNGTTKILVLLMSGICICVRWCWNACVLFGITMVGIVMLVGFFLFGTFGVLLCQGYPLAGVVIGCFGVTLCTGGIILFAIGLLRFKKTTQGIQVTENQVLQEEVEHGQTI